MSVTPSNLHSFQMLCYLQVVFVTQIISGAIALLLQAREVGVLQNRISLKRYLPGLFNRLFLGACTFIIAVCSTPLPNAVFGSSFASGIHRPPFRREKSAAQPHAGRVTSRPSCLGRWSFSWRWVGLLFGVRCYCSLCSLGAACCWFACLLCAVLRFCLVLSCYNEAPLFGSYLCRPRATALPLGPGG